MSQLATPERPDRTNSLGQSQYLPTRSNSLAPNDDWAYKDRGLPPEKEATKETVNANNPSSAATQASGISEDEDYVLEDVKPNIYQTTVGRRRAKLPDKDSVDPVVNENEENGNGLQPNGIPGRKHTSRWETFKVQAKRKHPGRPGEHVKLRHVMLHWEKATIKGFDKFVLHASEPHGRTVRQLETKNFVSWQHSQLDSMTLKGVEEHVNAAKVQGLRDSEIGLTRRLLRRIGKESERPSAGEKILTPRTLRYDVVDSSRYRADKSCIFQAFPYFALLPHKPRQLKIESSHPVRTLMQSKYRLTDTTERDQTQCFKLLRPKDLKTCLDREDGEPPLTAKDVEAHFISVPQFWSLIIGLDRLMTFGSIDDRSLQGLSAEIRPDNRSEAMKSCSLIRISFKSQQNPEQLTYPIEQCRSWFGIVNKQQQIRAVLSKERDSSDPTKYKLQYQGQDLEADTWASIQRSVHTEVLDLWMLTPKFPKVRLSSSDSPETLEPQQDAQTASQGAKMRSDSSAGLLTTPRNDGQYLSDATSEPAEIFERIVEVPIVRPLFEWRLLDESASYSKQLTQDERAAQAELFLDLICRNCSAIVGDVTHVPSKLPNREQHAVQRSEKGMYKATIKGRSSEEVTDELTQLKATRSKEHSEQAHDTCTRAAHMLWAFVSKSTGTLSTPRKLFWGALYEIMSRASELYLTDLNSYLATLMQWIEHIHLGVHYRRAEPAPENRETLIDEISEAAILQSSIVDACGAIFTFLIESAAEVWSDNTKLRCGKKAVKSFRSAVSSLETARDELIVESSGVADGQHVGPVLTPEAILIMHLERLVSGVYGNGNLKIISILEECLEHLSLKVRYRYSRRLLQMINSFEEEVAVVHDVLLQQLRVLGEFWGYLKPSSFDTPSTARKMRFEYEQDAIKILRTTIVDQLKNCRELQDRAKELAVQNVHLVETLADDNGRAIFIFTFITIIFLPLSFVTSFFGMNLQGIDGTTEKATYFWKIAMPLTGGIVALCIAVIIWGERMWFSFASIPRKGRDMITRELMKER